MVNKDTYTNMPRASSSPRLKLMLVPGWLEMKLAVAGFDISAAGDREKLSSILSGEDFLFYTNLQYGVISTLFGDQVAKSFLVSGNVADKVEPEALQTLLAGPSRVYGYDESSDPFAKPFRVTMLASDLVVISEAENSDAGEDVLDQLMKFLTATVGLRVALTLPLFELYVRKASV